MCASWHTDSDLSPVLVKICNQNIYGLNFFINFANEISFYYITLQNLFYYD